MPTICDTHIVLFWGHEPERLTTAARQALELGLLHERGRLVLPEDVMASHYLNH